MRRGPLYRFLLVVIACGLVACAPRIVQRSVPSCPLPPPPPPCAPASFVADAVAPWNLSDSVWTLDRVEGASSESNEWGLVPHGSHDLLLIGTDAALATYQAVARVEVRRVASCTVDTTAISLVTSVDSARIVGDADLVWFPLGTHWDGVAPENDISWDGHPAWSPNKSIVVFCSDRPGSLGGTDLWARLRTDDGWGPVLPVKGTINTPCDELSPQFVDDTTLVFASAGHRTVGGYDLFVATLRTEGDDVTSLNITNLGAWINTQHDELFPRMIGDSVLYFASNRPREARKDMDLYVATQRSSVVVPISNTPTTLITGTVIHQVTQQPVARATVAARTATASNVVASTMTDDQGTYELDVPVQTTVVIAAEAPGLFFDEITVQTSSVPDTVTVQQPLVLPVVYTLRINFPSAVFDAPYERTLDSNGVETAQRWRDDLDRLATNLKVTSSRLHRVVLVGHTDDVDTDESNFALGEQRVRFVIDELVQRGVDRELLEARSSGESQLPSRRDGESLDQWRKRARRVELQKVELQ